MANQEQIRPQQERPAPEPPVDPACWFCTSEADFAQPARVIGVVSASTTASERESRGRAMAFIRSLRDTRSAHTAARRWMDRTLLRNDHE